MFKIDKISPIGSTKKVKDFINFNSCKSTKSFLNKSKTSKFILHEKKISIEKEKELLFNSTTKEKTTKEKTTEQKDKNVIRKINKNIKINNNKKTIKKEESKYPTNYNIDKNKHSFINSVYFNNIEHNNLFHSRNKIKKEVNVRTKEYLVIMKIII